MLVAKMYVNYDKIDEIWVHNKGKTDLNGRYLYSIVKPEGHEDVEIWHRRELGYEPLLTKVLIYLKEARAWQDV